MSGASMYTYFIYPTFGRRRAAEEAVAAVAARGGGGRQQMKEDGVGGDESGGRNPDSDVQGADPGSDGRNPDLGAHNVDPGSVSEADAMQAALGRLNAGREGGGEQGRTLKQWGFGTVSRGGFRAR